MKDVQQAINEGTRRKKRKKICLKHQMFQLQLIGAPSKRLPQPTKGKVKFDIL